MQKGTLGQVAEWRYPGTLEKGCLMGVMEPGRGTLRKEEGSLVMAVWATAMVALTGGDAADSGDCGLDEFPEVEKNSAQYPQHLDCGL